MLRRRDLAGLAPLLAAVACSSSPQVASSGGSGSSSMSGSSAGAVSSGDSTIASGATAASGVVTSGSITSGSVVPTSGTVASGADASGSTAGSGTTSGASGTTEVTGSTSDAGHGVEPPSLDCPTGCNPDAGYPAMTALGTAMPIGDQTLPRKLYIENQCTYTIWTQGGGGVFPGGMLKTDPGQAFVVGWGNGFSGRLWPRSGCNENGTGCTQTGNDTLAEFTLTAGMDSDWYDISLVDGFTIPLAILQLSQPWSPSAAYIPGDKLSAADQECGSPVCALDLNPGCPASQQEKDSTGHIWGCKNGQSAGGGHQPTPVTEYLKAGCPTSYTYPFDDPQSLFLCKSSAQNGGVGAKDYKIIYCPTQGPVPGFP
jgi:thaumatin family protein